jgi:anti-sigma B factor antagonist
MELERSGSATILHVSGSASMEEAHRLQEKLEDLAGQQVPLIVLDLGAMDFIASMGLGAIIAAHLRVRRYNGEVRIACPSPAVAQLLEMTRLTKLFGIFASVREALQQPPAKA